MPAMPRTSAIARAAPRTLRSRLVLTSVLATLLIWAAFGVYLVIAARTLYVNRLSAQLATQARIVGEAIRPTLESGGDVDPLVKRLGSGAGERVTVIALDGRVLGDSEADPRTMENHAGRPEVKAALASGEGEAQRHSATLGENFLYVADKISGSPAVVVRVALPLGEVDAAIHRIQRDVIVAAAGAGLLAAVAALIAAARIAGPLAELRRQTSAVAAGRLDARVLPAATRELAELGRAFNAMTQRLAELRDQVAQSHDRLEATLANLSDGVVVTDAAGAVVDLNPAAARMLGVTEQAAIGRPFIVASRDHDLAGLLDAALATGETRTASVELGRGPRVLEATAQPLADGRERLGLVVLRDVTELRRLEAMRREFVANVSHELRTPLASIRLLVETLEASGANDAEVAESLFRQAVAEIDHLTGLVDELLDLARLESGHLVLHLEERDPGELLARAADRLRPQSERAGVELRVASSPGIGPVRVDPGRIEQALLNLIHNAIKFTPAGGTITLSAEARGELVRLAVADTGVGIPAEELPRIFERFYKRDPARRSPGTGLGLAIAKHIAQAHGGAIGAESAPGRGTTIWIDLPAIRE